MISIVGAHCGSSLAGISIIGAGWGFPSQNSNIYINFPGRHGDPARALACLWPAAPGIHPHVGMSAPVRNMLFCESRIGPLWGAVSTLLCSSVTKCRTTHHKYRALLPWRQVPGSKLATSHSQNFPTLWCQDTTPRWNDRCWHCRRSQWRWHWWWSSLSSPSTPCVVPNWSGGEYS